MKKRIPYIIAFFLLLGIEVLIGLYVRDTFIRPYVGDVLVAVLICCLVRCFLPDKPRFLGLWVFGFCVLAETIQLLRLPALLGLEGTVFAVILGATFDWKDIVCYLVGCAAFEIVCQICRDRRPRRS